MLSPLFRSIRTRGLLAVAMAALVRCTPDATPCVALPGSSIFLLPRAIETYRNAVVAQSMSSALQGRAAPFPAQDAPTGTMP